MISTDQELQATIHGFGKKLKEAGKTAATIESYCRDASFFVKYLIAHKLGLKNIDNSALLSFRNHLLIEQGIRSNSVRRTIIGVRQFFRYLSEESHIASTPFESFPIPNRIEGLPQPLTDEDIERALKVAQRTMPCLKSARDQAILGLLAWEGLKAHEIIELKWPHFLIQASEERSLGILHVPGIRTRTIKLDPRTAQLIIQYRMEFKRYSEKHKTQEQMMFMGFKGSDTLGTIPSLSRHGLKFILYELGQLSDLPHLNTEKLRHYAVDRFLSLGKSMDEIKNHLGLRQTGIISRHVAKKDNHGSLEL